MWHHGFWCFGFLFFILFFGFFIFRVVAFRKFRGRHWDRVENAEELLRKRLVNGEITEEDYYKIKEALKK